MVCLKTSHYKDLLRIGVPIMMGQMSFIVMGFADTLMVGHYGTNELAAAGFVNNILGLLIIGGMGFSYGITPVVGALLGEGRVHRIAGKLKNGLFACSGVGLLLMLLAGLFLLGLPWFGLPTELLPLARPYLLTLLLSLLPLMTFNAYKQFSDGIQDTAMPMWIILVANVLNIFGNWLLIFGNCGLPELG
ncbi:MAG: MATE family efflux transporter, partial [Bacteroidaceae bacterium]|nr:MATE family efflux transporter [Bacteroidaceae bacterium]